MNERWDKEFNLLAPAWIVAGLLAAAGPQICPSWGLQPIPLVALAIGCVLLAVTSFGREFSQRTFLMLLSQPVPRFRLWCQKVLVLLIALATVAIAFWLSSRWAATGNPQTVPFGLISTLIVLLAFSGGLWTTLLLRQITPAIIFTVLAPSAVLMLNALLGERLWPAYEEEMAITLLVSYAILGVAFSCWLLLRAQEPPWTGGEIAFRSFPQRRAQTVAAAETPRVSRSGWALFWKELHLQQFNAIGAAGALLLYLTAGGLSYFLEAERGLEVRRLVGGFFLVVCFVLPILVGAVGIAEERKFGTLDASQCLPVSRRRQFLVKLLATYAALVVGILIGGTFLVLTAWVAGDAEPNERWVLFLVYCLCWPLAATTVAFYASSLSRSMIQALGLALGFAIGGAVGFLALPAPGELLGLGLWRGPLVWIIGAPVAVGLLWWLSYRNYLSLADDWRTWRSNLLALGAAALATAALTTAIYHRVWELVLPLEMAHGPPRFSEKAEPKLVDGGKAVVVLLPDGRVWAKLLEWREKAGVWGCQTFVWEGRQAFLPGSNWVEVAVSRGLGGVVARQSDGSLWLLKLPDALLSAGTPPQRLGDLGRRWKSIGAGDNSFLAVADDGSLWEWRNPTRVPRLPQGQMSQVGNRTNWRTVLVNGPTYTALKTDGSLWRWGTTRVFTNGTWRFQNVNEPQPWRVFGEPHPVSVQGNGATTAIVLSDGTLWESGFFPQLILPAREAARRPPPPEVVRLGTRSDWKFVIVTREWGRLMGLRQDGSLWKSRREGNPLDTAWHEPSERLNRHSDWVSLTTFNGRPLALAADGSLWTWPVPDQANDGWLVPSRIPLRLGSVAE